MDTNEPNGININELKQLLVTSESVKKELVSLVEENKSLNTKESNSISNSYNKLIRLIEENEVKSFNLITEYSETANYGAWTEEERVFLDKNMIKALFSDEGWVYTICNLIASKIANQPMKVYKSVTNPAGKEIITEQNNHPFNEVIKDPNPFQSYYDWTYCIVVDLVLCGDCFLYRGMGTNNIYHLPSESMSLRIDAKGDLTGFDKYQSMVDTDRRFVRSYSLDEIIHIRRPNPSSFYQGFSPFVPARKNVLFNRYSLEYLNNYYLKGASSGIILEMTKDTNSANALRLLRSFENAYSGRKNQRRVKILPTGVTAKNFGESLADQQLKDYLMMNKEDILAILNVPKHEVGLQTQGSLGSEEYKTAIKNFWEATLKPQMGIIKGKLNKKLAAQLGEGFFLDYDLSNVEALQENEIQKGAIANSMLTTHTINEVRDIVYDLGKIEGGDIIPSLQAQQNPFFGFSQKPPITSHDTSQDNKIEEKPSVIETPEDSQPKIEMYAHQADKLIKASGDWFEQRKKKIEEATKQPIIDITDMFLGLFADQAIEVIKNLDKIVKKSINIHDEKNVKKVIQKAIAELGESLKSDLWLKQKEEIDAYVEMTFDHPSYQSDSKILDAIKKQTQKNAEQFIKERTDYVFEMVGRSSSDNIYRMIAESSKTSDSITQLASLISEEYSSPKKMFWRADRIARTEVLTVLSKTQDLASKEASKTIPDLYKMWMSTFDNRTRGNPGGLYKDSKADHWHLHGQVKKIDEDFIDAKNTDQLAFPRDPRGKAESVIQCRCTYIVLPKTEMQQFISSESEAKPNA